MRPSLLVVATALLAPFAARGTDLMGDSRFPAPPEARSGAAILQELRSFNTVATLLHVAAHPDDENTQLITYFARGRGYRTAYLSLTRGDGGQNEIGPEFDEKLGLARTQELLAARRLDGGRQFFTRAIDFGFSKTAEETLKFWDRDQVLGDVVRVIRRFRPDVIVTRFSPGSSGMTHGHHTSSGILGVEAFKLAGDPNAYPEQLQQGLTVWQPKRVALNAGGPGGGGGRGEPGSKGTVRVDIGGSDPVTGESFAAIAGRSRAQHVTQGFGNFGGRGGGGGPNLQSFIVLGGDAAGKDLFDGVDTTWTRFPGGAPIAEAAAAVIANFKTDDPAASVPALLELRAKVATLPADPVIDDKRAQLDAIIRACLGLTIETTAERPEVVPGEKLALTHAVSLATNYPVTLREVRAVFPATTAKLGQALKRGEAARGSFTISVPDNTPVSQPYWLREEPAAGIAHVADPKLIGLPENPPSFPVEYVFELGGQTMVVPDEPVFPVTVNNVPRRRRIEVIPPVWLNFSSAAAIVPPGQTRTLAVEYTSLRGDTQGEIRLEAPAGWKISPVSQPFHAVAGGAIPRVEFQVTAPAEPRTDRISAVAMVGGHRYSHQAHWIAYPHIPVQLLQPAARVRATAVDVATRGKNIGYLPGAGDDTVNALLQLGYHVTTLTGADLTAEKLAPLDAVVIGVRAFNERKDLAPNLPALWRYVENGGTVVAQYNRPAGNLPPLGPYRLSIQGPAPQLRVTDETAAVNVLATESPVLNTPNKISDSDFAGWVQERGAYFPSDWDKEHYTPILAMSDPGEAPLQSSVLVAHYGKGYYVYTGLAFFRQLPAGVPGAYRLFANLVSLGK